MHKQRFPVADAAMRQLALESNETRTCDLLRGRAEQISSLSFFVCYTSFPSTINIIISGSNNVKK